MLIDDIFVVRRTDISANNRHSYGPWDWFLYSYEADFVQRLINTGKNALNNNSIINCSFLSSKIPSASAYGIYVSQLIRYARAYLKYQDFIEPGKLLTARVLTQGCQRTKVVSTLNKFYGRYHDIVCPYNVAVSRIIADAFATDKP